MLKILIDLSWHDEPNLPALYQEEPFFLLGKSFQDDIMAMGLHNLTVACFEDLVLVCHVLSVVNMFSISLM